MLGRHSLAFNVRVSQKPGVPSTCATQLDRKFIKDVFGTSEMGSYVCLGADGPRPLFQKDGETARGGFF